MENRISLLTALQVLLEVRKAKTKGTTGWSPVNDPRYKLVNGRWKKTGEEKAPEERRKEDPAPEQPRTSFVDSVFSPKDKAVLQKYFPKGMYKRVPDEDRDEMQEAMQKLHNTTRLLQSNSTMESVLKYVQIQTEFFGMDPKVYDAVKDVDISDIPVGFQVSKVSMAANAPVNNALEYALIKSRKKPVEGAVGKVLSDIAARKPSDPAFVNSKRVMVNRLKKALAEQPVVVNMHLANLPKFGGRFGHLYNTDDGAGSNKLDSRYNRESILMSGGKEEEGVELAKLSPSSNIDGLSFDDHPNYGTLAGFQTANAYGNVVLVLKDSVKKRCSFTLGDSFDQYACHNPFAAENPEAGFSPDEYGQDSTSYKKFLEDMRIGRNYVEAQIYGGFTPDDVEAVVMGADFGGQKTLKEWAKAYPGIKTVTVSGNEFRNIGEKGSWKSLITEQS